MTDFDEIVKRMFENYAAGRNESIQAEQITVKYLGKEYIISDKEKVKYVIDKLKISEYNSHDWLKAFNEKEYGDEDIVVNLEKSKVIIPGNKTIANRYYMDEKNKFHLEYAKPIVYSHGTYFKMGEEVGTFGYSVKKK